MLTLTVEHVNALREQIDRLSSDVDDWCIHHGPSKKDRATAVVMLKGRALAEELMRELMHTAIKVEMLHSVLRDQAEGVQHTHH